MTVELRQSPSGPDALYVGDFQRGEVWGLPVDAPDRSFAVPIDGQALGSLMRASGYHALALAAGTYNNVAVPDGTRVLDITPTGAVIINGIAYGSSNTGVNFIVRKRGLPAAGTLTLANEAAASLAANRFVVSSPPFSLDNDRDCSFLTRASTRWQVVSHDLSALDLSQSSAEDGPAPVFGLRVTLTGGGASPSDVVLSAAVPLPLIVTGTVWYCTSAQVGQTLQLFTGPGGTGVALTDAMNAGAVAVRRSSVGATQTLAVGTPIIARRSGGNVVGTVIVFCQRAA